MKNWQNKLALRWEKLREQAAQLGWVGDRSPLICGLASRANLRWHQTRLERVADFISLDVDSLLLRFPGFKATKFLRLIEILEATLKSDPRPVKRIQKRELATNEWRAKLAPRWEKLRAKAAQLGWVGDSGPLVSELASDSNLRWYQTRSFDRVASFIALDVYELSTYIQGFGRAKIERLIEILEAALSGVDEPTSASQTRVQSSTKVCSDVLRFWEIPDDYPLNLLPLPVRLITFCESEGIKSLPDLLDIWAKLGPQGLLANRNIGKETISKFQGFVDAISNANLEDVQLWLPLHDSGKGLCLPRALAIANSRHSENKRLFVTRRLVDGLTLEETGLKLGTTRERVRQVELAYLKDIENTLTWFGAEKERILEAWADGKDWKTHVKIPTSPEAETLILAAIETCFEETQQGIARRLTMENDMQGWIGEIINHTDLHLGGVDLQKFLNLRVPRSVHEPFILALSSQKTLVVDNAIGLVKPAVPRVHETVRAILIKELEPLPLTTLALLVQSIEGCEQGDVPFIVRNRYRWSQSGHLDLKKVIWDQ